MELVPSLSAAEPRPAMSPPAAGRFSVVVEGVNNGDLTHAWSKLCRPADKPPSPEFKAVYPYVTTVEGNRFRFRGGDRKDLRLQLEKLLQQTMESHAIRTRIEG
jgi:hypothetical protein